MNLKSILAKALPYISSVLNFLFWILGYIVFVPNYILISLKKPQKNPAKIFSIPKFQKYDASGKLKKLLIYMNLYDKSAPKIEDSNLNDSIFGNYFTSVGDVSTTILIVLPNIKNSVDSTIKNFKMIRKIISLHDDTKIAINSQSVSKFWTLFFINRIVKVKPAWFQEYKAVIYLNSQSDHLIDIMNIPNLALLSKRFYCFYSKYISDNFPWLNICSEPEEILIKASFSMQINNYGYDEFIHKKNPIDIGHDDSKLTDSQISFIKHYELKKVNEKETHTRNHYSIGVVFPIYNNALFLKCRSFKSCLFNKNFNKINFLFIDDGSKSDSLIYIDKIREDFSNITIFKFNDNGSGSPSRPRNKGIMLAIKNNCDYLCFMDPDNHYTATALDNMLAAIIDFCADICAYNMWVYGRDYNNPSKEKVIKYNSIQSNYTSNDSLMILEKFKFRCLNMQQLIIKSKWFKDNPVYEYEDSIGEDMIFWYELVLKNPKIAFINEVNSIYFNFQKGSLTNNLSASFFVKAINGYEHIYEILKSNKVLTSYLKCEFYNNFYNGILRLWDGCFDSAYLTTLSEIFARFDKENESAKVCDKYRKKCVLFFKQHGIKF